MQVCQLYLQWNYDVHSTVGASLPNTRLIPRPSHRPVFDCLQYAKTEGEAWYIYHVNDVSVCLGRQRGGRGSPLKE